MSDAISRIRWGFLLIFLNINLGRFDILPDFLGYLLFLGALEELEKISPDIRRLAPFCRILAAVNAVIWIFPLEIPVLSPILNLILPLLSIYVVFTLLSEVAAYAQEKGYEEGPKIRRMRNEMAVFQVLMYAFISQMNESLAWILGALYVLLILKIFLNLSYVREAEDKKEAHET